MSTRQPFVKTSFVYRSEDAYSDIVAICSTFIVDMNINDFFDLVPLYLQMIQHSTPCLISWFRIHIGPKNITTSSPCPDQRWFGQIPEDPVDESLEVDRDRMSQTDRKEIQIRWDFKCNRYARLGIKIQTQEFLYICVWSPTSFLALLQLGWSNARS